METTAFCLIVQDAEMEKKVQAACNGMQRGGGAKMQRWWRSPGPGHRYGEVGEVERKQHICQHTTTTLY